MYDSYAKDSNGKMWTTYKNKWLCKEQDGNKNKLKGNTKTKKKHGMRNKAYICWAYQQAEHSGGKISELKEMSIAPSQTEK